MVSSEPTPIPLQTRSKPQSSGWRYRLKPLRWLMYVLLILGAIIALLPFGWTALTSFKTYGEHINRKTWPKSWTSEPYRGLPSGQTYTLELQPAQVWEGAPTHFSPLMEAHIAISGPEELSPIIAKKIEQEIINTSDKAIRYRELAQERLDKAAALPAEQTEEIAKLNAEAADLEQRALKVIEANNPYPLDVLILAVDTGDDNQVNYDSFVLTVNTRVKQQETTTMSNGEWAGPYYKDAPDMVRWGPHFRVVDADPEHFVVQKSWRFTDMLFFNYLTAWDDAKFAIYLRNSVIITLSTVAGVLTFSVLAAYAFARMKFPGKNLLFTVYLSTLMIPGVVILIPNFLTVTNLDTFFEEAFGLKDFWINNLPGLVVPFLASTFSIFLLRQFFAQIPHELFDAALIDGCGHLRFLTRIVLPLSKAPIMSIIIFNAIWSWNSLQWPILITSNDTWRPITVGLTSFVTEAGPRAQLMMAGAVIAIIPILVLYFFTQKQFTEGISTTGLKG